MRITKREIIASITIIAVMMILGFVIAGRFDRAAVLVEPMNPTVVRHFKKKTIEGSHAQFTWGVKNGAALAFWISL